MPHQWSHGHFYWNELMTRNAERDKKFSRRDGRLERQGDPRYLTALIHGSPRWATSMSAACFR